jgi:hypothetical protein
MTDSLIAILLTDFLFQCEVRTFELGFVPTMLVPSEVAASSFRTEEVGFLILLLDDLLHRLFGTRTIRRIKQFENELLQ